MAAVSIAPLFEQEDLKAAVCGAQRNGSCARCRCVLGVMRSQSADFGAAGSGAVVCLNASKICQAPWGNPHVLKLAVPEADRGLFIARAAFFQRFGNIKYRQQNCFVAHLLHSSCYAVDEQVLPPSTSSSQIILYPGEHLLQLSLL